MEHDDLERLLVEHTDAWNAHDLDRLMRLFAPDCVFHASAGPDAEGATYVGHDRVRSAFAAVLASMPDPSGARAVTTCSATATASRDGGSPPRRSTALDSTCSAATSSPS